jgi:hypothetical protein
MLSYLASRQAQLDKNNLSKRDQLEETQVLGENSRVPQSDSSQDM